MGPHGILEAALEEERRMGRQRGTPKGPRCIDIDLLLYGDMIIRTSDLQVPHPLMRERGFVLIPLLEIAPLAVDPLSGESYEYWCGLLEDQGVSRVSSGTGATT